MPTLTELPSTNELLCDTTEFAPIAVALVMPAAPFELEPIKVLLFSVVFDPPAPFPTNVLLAPVVLEKPALAPKKELSLPVVLENPVLFPKKELSKLVVLSW